MNSYEALKSKHQAEVNAFPMAFAFSNEQFESGMRSLGLDPTETDKVYSLGGTGGFYRRSDAPALREMFDRHAKERQEALESDSTGDGYIYDMFRYELANHEYGYTWNLDDTLDSLDLTMDDIEKNPQFKRGLNKAIEDIRGRE